MRRAVASVVLLGTIACAAEPARPEVWITTADRSFLFAHRHDSASVPLSPDGLSTIVVDPTQRMQVMAGFGAAITDASALVLGGLPPARRDSLLLELFSPLDAALSFTRITIGASDFSPTHYTLDDVAGDANDATLARFDLSLAAPVLAIARRARELNPRLTVMATPWSAPAWMKQPRQLNGGTLRADAYASFAAYLSRVVRAFDSAHVTVDLLSLQNEPHHEPPDYPGMRLSPAQRAALFAKHVGPVFAREHPDVDLLDWDHNWDDPGSPLAVLSDSLARRFVSGVAWHCYAGDVSAQQRVHDAHPDKDTWFTECSGGAWATNWGDNLLWNVRHLIIGATRGWARGVLLWNLALDEHHGPHRGGCADCRGVVTVNSTTGEVTRNEEYYALTHASRFVRSGATRVASSGGDSTLAHVAFVNPDGQRVLLIVNDHGTARSIRLSEGDHRRVIALPARAVATITWAG